MCVHKESPSLGFDDSVLPNSLNHSHIFLLCSQPSPSPKYYIYVPIDNPVIFNSNVELGYEDNVFGMLGGSVGDYVILGYFREYYPSIDLYYICLEDLPRKVMWTTFFDPPCGFSMGFAKVKRILILFGVIFVICLLPCIF